jgi:hypothetical protein
MPGHGNFTSVTLGPDDDGVERLTVNGVTVDDNGDAVAAEDVKAVYVAVEHAAARTAGLGATTLGVPQELRSAAVPAAEGAGGWTVMLDQGNPPYAVHDKVLLVGVLVEKDDKPSFWHETLEIEPG